MLSVLMVTIIIAFYAPMLLLLLKCLLRLLWWVWLATMCALLNKNIPKPPKFGDTDGGFW